MVELVGFGFQFETLLDMDIESFDELVVRTSKIQAIQKVERLNLNFYSAQADQKSIKKLSEKLSPKKSKGGRLNRGSRSRGP